MKKFITSKITQYLKYLLDIRGYSPLTIKTYKEALSESFEYIEINEENNQTYLNLMPYRIYISESNPKTISKKLSAIRSFVEYLKSNQINVILSADESIKVASTLPKPIAHKYIVEALTKADLKESLLVVMLYTLGLRISELCTLKLCDISEEWVRVIGKGSKQRDIPLIKTTRVLIDEYLAQNYPKIYLFEVNDEVLSQNSLRYIITKVFKRVSLKVTPHQLRHSFASELLNSHAPIADVSELLGHASMATTQIYTKLGSALKLQNYNKAHPLSGLK